jgi:PAS domain S-box-containing protein
MYWGAMATELRKTGIDVVGDLVWGTHLCLFYETKHDLLELLVPYFKAGLEHNEFCVWVVAEPVNKADAESVLQHAVPDFARYVAEQRIEILPHDEWCTNKGTFAPRKVRSNYKERLQSALARGHVGMRVSGNTTWLKKKDWRKLREYEKELAVTVANQRLIVLCTFPLAASGAEDLLDVAHTHQVAVALRHGRAEIVEIPELKQAKAELKRVNEELEQRIDERTRQLARTNEELKKEIAERQRVEDALRLSEERFRRAFEYAPIGMTLIDPEDRWLKVNQAFCEMIGYSEHELLGMTFRSITHPADLKAYSESFRQLLAGERGALYLEKRYFHKDGHIVWANASVTVVRSSAGNPLYLVSQLEDITERKLAEETLQHLSGRLLRLQDEERRNIARELHETTAQNLSALRMLLFRINDLLEVSRKPLVSHLLTESLELAERCLGEIRTISYLLHPPFLEEMGLAAALGWYTEGFTQRSNITVTLEVPPEFARLPRDAELVLFRIVQESLTNIHYHSGSAVANIRLDRTPSQVILTITDKGRGMPPEVLERVRAFGSPIGVGIAGMHERVRQLGGRLDLHSSNQGTTVIVTLPIK